MFVWICEMKHHAIRINGFILHCLLPAAPLLAASHKVKFSSTMDIHIEDTAYTEHGGEVWFTIYFSNG